MFSISLGYSMSAATPDAVTTDMMTKIKQAGALVVAAAGNGACSLSRHDHMMLLTSLPKSLEKRIELSAGAPAGRPVGRHTRPSHKL